MACTGKQLSARRKLSIVPAMIAVWITLVAWPLSGLLWAQSSPDTTVPSPPAAPVQAGTSEVLSTAVPKINIDYTESSSAAAERLATSLTSATTADAIRPAAYEALARSGIAVKSSSEVIAATGPRIIKRWLMPTQADNLALDFLEHQGWTLSELTRAVAEYPNGPGPALLKRPETLGILLREWVAMAKQSPADPEAFAPLLLARIAQIRGGGSDFTQGPIIPEQIELSYLELMLFTAGAYKGLPPQQTPVRLSRAASLLECATSWSTSLLVPSAHAAGNNPCTWVKDNVGKNETAEAAQDFTEEGVGWMMDKALDRTGKWLDSLGDGILGKTLGQAAGLLKITNLLTSMISMYGGYGLTLTWDPAKPHYLGHEHGNAFMHITATVSARPLADDATLACLKFLGIEKTTSDSMKDTTVEWVSLYGTPKHAVAKFPPSSRENIGPDGKAVLELTMSQEMLGEEVKKSGRIKHDQIVMQANLIVYKSNPGKIMAATLFGGVVGGNIEVLKGWFANWFPKRAVARVPVEWHKLSRWRCVVEVAPGSSLRIVYTSGLGTKSIWTWAFEGDPMFSGSGSFNLTSGSARFVMTPKVAGEGATGQGAVPHTASIGGTNEEPTLILGIDGTARYTASSGGGRGSLAKNVKGQRTYKLEEIE
ncbi:hypothetical protein [Desulfobulbus propionicus]